MITKHLNILVHLRNKQYINKDIDVAMPIYKLIEYSNNHSKTSGKIWQYYREEPALV